MDPTTDKASKEVVVVCPNCKAQNKLGDCLKERAVDDLIEGGLECPDCGHWTHSYWKNEDLIVRAERLEQMRLLFVAKQSNSSWGNYTVARDAYARDFEAFQERMKRKHKGKEVQPA